MFVRRSPASLAALALLLMTITIIPVAASGKPEVFYSVGLGGYSPASYGAPEALELSAGLEFLPRSPINPSLALRCLVPINPADFSLTRVFLGMDFSMGYFLRHPFSWVSPRKVAWSPSVGLAFGARLGDLSDISWIISLSPIRLFTGNSYQSFGSIVFPFSSGFLSEGWGIRLAEFSYLLH